MQPTHPDPLIDWATAVYSLSHSGRLKLQSNEFDSDSDVIVAIDNKAVSVALFVLPYAWDVDIDKEVRQVAEWIAMATGTYLARGPASGRVFLKFLPSRLWHGSPVKLISMDGDASAPTLMLEPRPSSILQEEKVVFATSERWMALAFATRFGGRDIDLGVAEGIPYLAEAKPDAFEQLKKRDGYLYKVYVQGFCSDPRLGMANREFINREAVPILEQEYIPNVWDALPLAEPRLQLVKYADRIEFGVQHGIPASTQALVVHVTGVRGSGKSWLYEQLRKLDGLQAVECDDLLHDAHWAVRKRLDPAISYNGRQLRSLVVQEICRRRDRILMDAKAPVLVFCGLTVPLDHVDIGFFLEIDEKDIPETYRRLVKREYEKVLESKKEIKQMIKEDDAQFLVLDIERTINGTGTPFTMEDYYRDDYLPALRDHIERGYRVRKQPDVLKEIQEILATKQQKSASASTTAMDTSS